MASPKPNSEFQNLKGNQYNWKRNLSGLVRAGAMGGSATAILKILGVWKNTRNIKSLTWSLSVIMNHLIYSVDCAQIFRPVFMCIYLSGVFSMGATGAIAPVILRKRLVAPVILHLPYWASKEPKAFSGNSSKFFFALRAYVCIHMYINDSIQVHTFYLSTKYLVLR